MWDSGKVESRKCFDIQYEGEPLRARHRYWWQVHLWESSEEDAEISSPSWWEMGLLDPNDWTGQWLAMEDEVTRGDRETGLNWIWGESSSNSHSRKFRAAFELPSAAGSGYLVAVVNDWYWWMQITGIWLDGERIAGPGAWIEAEAAQKTKSHLGLSRQQLPLGPLQQGRHLIAIEIGTREVWNVLSTAKMPDVSYVAGCAVLGRFALDNGETLRVSSQPGWATTLAAEGNWYSVDYDDSEWSAAQPAVIEGYQPWPARPAMFARRQFNLEKAVAQARLYVTALGAYEARLNGQRVGDALLTPEPSQYAKRVLYRTYDVSNMLHQGENALGLLVGDGWYGGFDGRFAWAPPPRRAIVQLEVGFVDGSSQTIATDSNWRVVNSPLLVSEIKIGEVYDARLELPEWDRPGFDDTHWESAGAAPVPPCRLVSQLAPPIRIRQTLKPVAISKSAEMSYLIDFGQHFTGWCQVRVRGSRGRRVELIYAELLTQEGGVDPSNMHDPTGEPKRDVFFLSGHPSGEVLAPRFVYRGFRYVQIEGLDHAPTIQSVDGMFIHSDLKFTGRFRCADESLQNLWKNILQTQRSNFTGIPTDNAVREFRGWMGDAAVFWDTAAFNMDICAFTSRQMDNAVDDQSSEGALPSISPQPKHGNAFHNVSGAPGWGDAGIILPSTAWCRYGDTAVVERNWSSMSRYLQFIEKHNPNFLWENNRGHDYGDNWALDPTTPKDLIATAYWAHSADLMAGMARSIARVQDAAHYQGVFEKIARAFNAAFVRADGNVGSGSQTSYVLALQFKLLKGDVRVTAANRLAADVRGRGTALTTGILGTQFILDVLADVGHEKLAYDLLWRTAPPSWANMIRSGATSIWESWSGIGARNQAPFGSIGGFLYRRVAGIDAAAPGFTKIAIRPLVDSRLKYGGADYDSVMGRIVVDWKWLSNGRLRIDVTIPPNADALVHLPVELGRRVTEGGSAIERHPDIDLIEVSSGKALVEVGSGAYSFLIER